MKMAIDPSSTCLGYAVWDGDQLHEAGRIRPLAKHDAFDRIRMIVEDLEIVLSEFTPSEIAIEVPAPNQVQHRGKRPRGQAMYGCAVGAVWLCCGIHLDWQGLHLVRADVWKRGMSKENTKLRARYLFPDHYTPKQDPGGDVADALLLGVWIFGF